MIVTIDNGVTGSLAYMYKKEVGFHTSKEYTFKDIDYQKTKKTGITRINGNVLYDILNKGKKVYVLLERPMINPRRFKPSMSAIRCLEATLIVLHRISAHREVYYKYIDSREWQSYIIPDVMALGKGKIDLIKAAASDFAILQYPQFTESIMKHDGDALAMLSYFRKRKKYIIDSEWRTFK